MHVSSDPEYWNSVNEKFFAKYKGIDECHAKWRDLVMEGKPIVGPLGTFWPISNRDKRGELYVPWTTLSNFPVQGTGADVMTVARVSAFNRLGGLEGIKLVQTVHDSITVDCEDKHTKFVAKTFYEVFRDLQKNIKKVFNYEWVVPLEGEVKIGVNQASFKEIKYQETL